MLGEGGDDSDCDSCTPSYLRDGAEDGEWNGGVLSVFGAVLSFLLFLLAILAAIALLVTRFFPGIAGADGIWSIKRK